MGQSQVLLSETSEFSARNLPLQYLCVLRAKPVFLSAAKFYDQP